jgi:hypothetical protein
VLKPCAHARRRPTALVASLGTGEAPALACLPAFHPHATVHRAAAVTAAVRRQSSPPANSPPPLRFPATPR